MKKDKKKAKKERRILVAALLVAAVTVAGSTFAWFSSQDEVTNRLSASADYGVSIAETFTPPEEWVPGQEVNKDVFAVNTGNVDALVKQAITSKITVTNEADGSPLSTADTVPDNAVKLSTQYSSSTDSTTGAVTYSADEVTSIMAGSVLAYTNNTSDVAKVGRLTINVDGTTKTNNTPSLTQVPNSETATAPGESAEGTLFTPAGAGLYIFRRSITKTDNASADSTETYTYSGYYYDGTNYYKVSLDDTALTALSDQGYNGVLTKALTKTTSTDANSQTTEVYAVKADSVSTVKAAATWVVESTVVATPALTYEAAVTSGDAQHPARLVATYGGTVTTGTDAAADDIVIYINLNNIVEAGSVTADKWQILPTTVANNQAVFYYTNDLEAGHTSAQLVDSIVMAPTTTNAAYKNFDFDLNVDLESVQVVKSSDQTELVPGAAAPATETSNVLGAKATATNTDKEISVVSWSL